MNTTDDKTNPKDILGLLKVPLRLVPSSLCIYVAKVMALGAVKYGPYNWRDKKVRRTVYLEAALRHILQALDGEDEDDESHQPHEAHVASCMGIILDAKACDCLIDDRPHKGPAGRLIKEMVENKKPEPSNKPERSSFVEAGAKIVFVSEGRGYPVTIPDGFVWKGEVRVPQKGEVFLSATNEALVEGAFRGNFILGTKISPILYPEKEVWEAHISAIDDRQKPGKTVLKNDFEIERAGAKITFESEGRRYNVVVPEGFEWHGEIRTPQTGEIFLSCVGEALTEKFAYSGNAMKVSPILYPACGAEITKIIKDKSTGLVASNPDLYRFTK